MDMEVTGLFVPGYGHLRRKQYNIAPFSSPYSLCVFCFLCFLCRRLIVREKSLEGLLLQLVLLDELL